MAKIFLIEDDEALAMGLLFTLEAEGYQTVRASGARQAREIFAQGGFDLILLDVMLPDGNGYDLCKEFKKSTDIPIVFLTSCDDELSIVMGLDGGGDDYVTKPFPLKVLISRIKAQLRRSSKDQSAKIRFGNLAVDLEQSQAFSGGKKISLTATELRLLATLVRHAGQTLTRTSMLDRLWDSKGEFVDDNTLSVHIRHLREKLDAAASTACIVTVRGVGYRMEVME